MKRNNQAIYENLVSFVLLTEQDRLRDVISYAIGYYGPMTTQVWYVIQDLIKEGTINEM